MTRRLVWAVALMVFTAVTDVGLAAASCTTSSISVFVPSVVIGRTLEVSWHVSPLCDVIETGLLIGTSETMFNVAGEPIHAASETYASWIPIETTSIYFVAAYAMDEEGNVIYSPSRPVFAVIPPADLDPHGSHGPLASYTGTDADFLQPAGEPHFASLRSVEATNQLKRQVLFFGQLRETFRAGRLVASTQRGEVESKQSLPLPFGFPVNLAGLSNALLSLDQAFQFRPFPRTGLYAVFCGLDTAFDPVNNSCGVPRITGFADLFLDLSRIEQRETISGPAGTAVSPGSSTAMATYFIPVAPPGKQIGSARLTAFFLGQSTAAGALPRLNGKTHVAGTPNCQPTLVLPPRETNEVTCFGTLTWDFTPEAQALSAQGGGLLTIAPDLPPTAVTTSPFGGGASLVFENAHAFLRVTSSFPWAHRGEGDMTFAIAFEGSCPKELKVTPTPARVRPALPPRTPLTGDLPILPRESTIEALVKACPPGGTSPSTVEVRLRVDATQPQPGSAEAGGHAHDSRPDSARGTLNPDRCVAVLDAQGMGSCTVQYVPSEVASIETIVAEATDFPSAQAKINVMIPNLVELPSDPARYVLVGAPDNHAGTNDPCRFDPPTSKHFQNHFGTPALNAAVIAIANAIRLATGILVRVNDMSLPTGGLFDVRNNWASSTGHLSHRTGQNADIGFCGVQNGQRVEVSPARLRAAIRKATLQEPLMHDDHFHVIVK